VHLFGSIIGIYHDVCPSECQIPRIIRGFYSAYNITAVQIKNTKCSRLDETVIRCLPRPSFNETYSIKIFYRDKMLLKIIIINLVVMTKCYVCH